MSVIVYENGCLYSDSRGEWLQDYGHEPQIYEAVKIHKSKCGRLALATVGVVVTDKALDFIMDELLVHACTYVLDGTWDAEFSKEFRKMTAAIRMIAMTRDFAFTEEYDSPRIPPSTVRMAFGSVEPEIRCLLHAGWDVEKALTWLFHRDKTVAGPIQKLHSSELLPLLNKPEA